MTPPSHVWLEVAGQIRQRTPTVATQPAASARLAPLWHWAGLAAALVVITTGTYVFLRLERRTPVAPPPTTSAQASGSAQVVADELAQAMAHYQKAIAELEVITKTNNGALDPDSARGDASEQPRRHRRGDRRQRLHGAHERSVENSRRATACSKPCSAR